MGYKSGRRCAGCVSVLRPRERGNSLLARCANSGWTEELYGMTAVMADCCGDVFKHNRG